MSTADTVSREDYEAMVRVRDLLLAQTADVTALYEQVQAERDRLRDDLEIALQRADRHKATLLAVATREGRLREALERIATSSGMDATSAIERIQNVAREALAFGQRGGPA